ncbi:hypothetical protein D3C85_1088900 [compost metagenome]
MIFIPLRTFLVALIWKEPITLTSHHLRLHCLGVTSQCILVTIFQSLKKLITYVPANIITIWVLLKISNYFIKVSVVDR